MSSTYHNRFYAMGTRMNLLLPATDEDRGHRIFQQVKRETERIELKLSRFDENSDISRLNRYAFQRKAAVDGELFDVLMACKTCWEVTNGAFDPTLRPLMEVEIVEAGAGNRSQTLSDCLGMQHVSLNEKEGTVSFQNEHIEIDLGGFGKGYALEKVSDIFRRSSVKSAFISFGESSVYAYGEHPAGGHWKIGIQDYLNPGRSIHEFRVKNRSVSTSGNFYLDDNGNLRNHRHVINPQTQVADEECKSVSVVSDSPLLAEMLSTACLVMDDQAVSEVKSIYENLQILKVDYSSGKPVKTIY